MNSLILSREAWHTLSPRKTPNHSAYGISPVTLSLLDFYIIEEEDGSATFIKNRLGQKSMAKEEYSKFKQEYLN